MKKILLSLIVVLLSINSYSQIYNMSGKWTGTVKIRFEDGTDSVSKMTLNLRLLDTCNLVYRVEQIETGINSNHIGYNFIQTNNSLLRDGMTYYKDYDKEIGELNHLKLTLCKNRLTGIRTDMARTPDEIILYHNKPLKKLESCKVKEKIIKETNCSNSMIKSVFTDTVIIDKNEIIDIGLSDTDSEDGDIISIFTGSNRLMNSIPLYNREYTIPILVKSDTVVTWCAYNQGKSGLNTGKFSIGYKDKKKDIMVHIKSNERVSFFIKMKQEESKIVVTDWVTK